MVSVTACSNSVSQGNEEILTNKAIKPSAAPDRSASPHRDSGATWSNRCGQNSPRSADSVLAGGVHPADLSTADGEWERRQSRGCSVRSGRLRQW